MIKIICVGKLKEKFYANAANEYIKRISKYSKITIEEIEDSTPQKETPLILKHIKEKDYVIALDIEGEQLNSLEFASKIDKTLITTSQIAFIIGGSNGLTQKIKERANYRLSFSKMTFPHQLFRVILLEQIYRSFKILNNETYHK